MKAPTKKDPSINNWNAIAQDWINKNRDVDYEYKDSLPKFKEVPDYAHLDGERIEESKEDKEKRKEKLGKK